MKKQDKKRKKLQERLLELETELKDALTKKTSNVKEISVPEQTRKIEEVRQQLAKLNRVP